MSKLVRAGKGKDNEVEVRDKYFDEVAVTKPVIGTNVTVKYTGNKRQL